ncbi:hypothetical protein OUZ56_033683 [Daphnia magna]|uniref:Regulatory protein zeste n=1 Tax=Daphnia magna TaxID=35525 RepID=A0ABR0BAZ6_9CRUS|nr:hypothetical protein OUZ56_033683 [Daphnia magna]
MVRNASATWSSSETEILVDELIARKDIIFGAQSSTVTNKSKQQHWDEIVATINQQFPSQHPRDREETKKKWNNLSSDARKNLKKHKNSVEQTRKGKAFPMKPLNEKIVNMIWGESSAALPGNSISGGVETDVMENANDTLRINNSASSASLHTMNASSCAVLAKTVQSSFLENEEDDLSTFEFDDSQSNQSSLCQTFSNADFADGVPSTSRVVALLPKRTSTPVLSTKTTDHSSANIVFAKRSQATLAPVEKDAPLVAVTSFSTTNGESLNKNPLALRDIVNRAKRAHAEKSNVSVSKRLMRDRFDLLHSVIAVRQLIGKPIDAEKDIPVDLLEMMNNPSQLI